MRIMYVEDNPANVFLIRRVAKEGNHEIFSFIDGLEAIEKFDEVNPDLVLMDIQLSGELNGLDVVRRLRAAGHVVPIIAVTAYAMVGDKERCIEAGCTDYVAKPLPVGQLVDMFRQYTIKHRETQELMRVQAEAQASTTEVAQDNKASAPVASPKADNTQSEDLPISAPPKAEDKKEEVPVAVVTKADETAKEVEAPATNGTKPTES